MADSLGTALSERPLSKRVAAQVAALRSQLSSPPLQPTHTCFVVKFGLVAVIEPWGAVYPCIAYDGKGEYDFGNVNDDSFSTIWHSARHAEVVSKVGDSICHFDCRHKHQNQRILEWEESLGTKAPLAWQI